MENERTNFLRKSLTFNNNTARKRFLENKKKIKENLKNRKKFNKFADTKWIKCIKPMGKKEA